MKKKSAVAVFSLILFYTMPVFASDSQITHKEANPMMKSYSQVICTSSRVKQGCVEEVKLWLKTLENERRSETLESFRNEGVELEAAFLKEENGEYFLVYFMRAEDITQAMNLFQKSTLPIDDFHKQCWEKFTQDHEILTPIFHLETNQF